MEIILPKTVQTIIAGLENCGYEAYAVGGCVRDSLLGFEPKDWDICTSARPKQVMECFSGYRIVESGLQHGTVSLILNHQSYEITTYRIDGDYSDNRHPDRVDFTVNLAEDLARRDFTVNAMAYNPKKGLADFFGGMNDLNAGIIRCAGDPVRRFQEDALRIMRAMRFASVLGFSIETHTAEAMLSDKERLHNITPERIAGELNKLIVGDSVCDVLTRHLPVLLEVLPELCPDYRQESQTGFPHPNLQSLGYAPKAVIPRLALLFCDVANPMRRTQTEEDGYCSDIRKGAERAKDTLLRLKYDKRTTESVTALVLNYGTVLEADRMQIKRQLNRIGPERFRQLIAVQRAGTLVSEETQRRESLRRLDEVLLLLDEIITQQICFSLKGLAVNGRDLLELGFPEGTEIGAVLNRLLELVMNEKAENTKAELLRIAGEILTQNTN